jgi:hypothetical protein
MTRMGISERGQGSYLPVQSIHAIRVIRGSNRQAGESPPLPRMVPAASTTLGQDPGQPPSPARAQNQADKALLVLATSGGQLVLAIMARLGRERAAGDRFRLD